MRAWSLGPGDPPEEEMETHRSYSCLENPVARGAWRASHAVAKSQTWRRDLITVPAPESPLNAPPRLHPDPCLLEATSQSYPGCCLLALVLILPPNKTHFTILTLCIFCVAVLGLASCCAWAFSSCGAWRLLLVAGFRLLISLAFLVAELGLHGPLASVVGACGFRSCRSQLWSRGSVVMGPGLSCYATCGMLPEKGFNSVSCTSQWILYHWAAWEVPDSVSL